MLIGAGEPLVGGNVDGSFGSYTVIPVSGGGERRGAGTSYAVASNAGFSAYGVPMSPWGANGAGAVVAPVAIMFVELPWRRLMTKNAMTPAMIAAPPIPPTTPPTMAPVLLFLPDDEDAAAVGVAEGARNAVASLPVAVGSGEEKPIEEVAEGMGEDSGGSWAAFA